MLGHHRVWWTDRFERPITVLRVRNDNTVFPCIDVRLRCWNQIELNWLRHSRGNKSTERDGTIFFFSLLFLYPFLRLLYSSLWTQTHSHFLISIINCCCCFALFFVVALKSSSFLTPNPTKGEDIIELALPRFPDDNWSCKQTWKLSFHKWFPTSGAVGSTFLGFWRKYTKQDANASEQGETKNDEWWLVVVEDDKGAKIHYFADVVLCDDTEDKCHKSKGSNQNNKKKCRYF